MRYLKTKQKLCRMQIGLKCQSYLQMLVIVLRATMLLHPPSTWQLARSTPHRMQEAEGKDQSSQLSRPHRHQMC
jgi:hypothetical protein